MCRGRGEGVLFKYTDLALPALGRGDHSIHPFYRWGNCGSKRRKDLPTVMKLDSELLTAPPPPTLPGLPHPPSFQAPGRGH